MTPETCNDQSLCLHANKAAAELVEVQMQIMQVDANMDAVDEHVRGFAAQQEELEADLERSRSRTARKACCPQLITGDLQARPRIRITGELLKLRRR